MQNKNSTYSNEIIKLINEKSKEVFEFFNSEIIDFPCTVYVYDSIESLVNGLKIRGFKDLPDYMCACQKDEDNSINYFEPKDNPNSDEWSKEEYKKVIFHEFIHAVQYNLFGTLPEWLTEGTAKYLDGTYKNGINYLLENYINVIPIPEQLELENKYVE